MVSKSFRKCSLAAPALFGASLLVANGAALAEEYTSVADLASGQSMGQVTSVSQLSDVQPTDWSFQALQSLVERYGCIAGYPDQSYRGNQNLSRYEFAAGLNACLDRVNEIIAAGTADLVSREDLTALQRLQEEFAAELATLRGRADALEARTAELETNRFSTTTKLKGEVIFGIADSFGDQVAFNGAGRDLGVANPDDETNTTLGYRVRLNFDTSFTGKDRLRTRLSASNLERFTAAGIGTRMSRLGYDGSSGGDFEVGVLGYRFPVGDKLTVLVDAIWDGLIDSVAGPFESSGSGSISRFGRYNPVYRTNNEGAALSLDYEINDDTRVQLSYAADEDSNDPSPKGGLFNGGYFLVSQVVAEPFGDDLRIAIGYNRSYSRGGNVSLFSSTGTAFANDPFGGQATIENTGFLNLEYQLTKKVTAVGRFGATFATAKVSGPSGRVDVGDRATVFNGALGIAVKDIGKEGSLAGLLAGVPPFVSNNDAQTHLPGKAREDEDIPIHIEAWYRYPINKHMHVTPGVFAVINPEGNSDNGTLFMGTIRTTFKF